MDVVAFNTAYAEARDQRDADPNFDVPGAQQLLRAMIAGEPDGDDRAWALRMIDKLTTPSPPPREYGPLYHQAGAIHAEAFAFKGTDAEKADALAKARREIWAIADRAPVDEAPHIRGMTRALEYLETTLRGDWPRG
ncbi:hypothetical protein [Kribbella sp. NPDC048915]|uniref:hypothetical protein n=1 Tax=Kribbella sp. NPDC048915 TaxID=3155148 RepID=UPI0033C99A91